MLYFAKIEDKIEKISAFCPIFPNRVSTHAKFCQKSMEKQYKTNNFAVNINRKRP